MMSKYEIKMLKSMYDGIIRLVEEKGYSPYDISSLLEEIISDNSFSEEFNKELLAIQEMCIEVYKEKEEL